MAEGLNLPPGMPGPVSRLVRTIDAISVWSGKLFAWLVIPLTGALVYEVLARYLFSAPTQWAFDTTYMLYGTHFMMVAAYGLAKHDHIRTDFLYRLLPERWQAIIDTVLYLVLFIPALVVFTWVTADFAWESWVQRERSNLSAWLPPVYPLKAVLPLSALLLLLQGISEMVKSAYAAKRGSWE